MLKPTATLILLTPIDAMRLHAPFLYFNVPCLCYLTYKWQFLLEGNLVDMTYFLQIASVLLSDLI